MLGRGGPRFHGTLVQLERRRAAVNVPAARTGAAPRMSRPQEQSVNMPPLRRILLIGDSGRFVRTLASDPGLRDVSFERTAGAAETLRRVRALPCDLVITDRTTPIAEDLALVE